MKSDAAIWVVTGLITVFVIFGHSIVGNGAYVLSICTMLYLMPIYAAWVMDSPLFAPVLILDVICGWTGIGWVMAFVMAVWPKTK